MASNPYTQRFVYAEGSAKTVTWEVPEGRRAIVTDILAQSGGVEGSQVFLGIHGVYAFSWFAPAPYANRAVATKAVAYERETITLITVGSDTRAIVCGYLFADDVGNPGGMTVRERGEHASPLPGAAPAAP